MGALGFVSDFVRYSSPPIIIGVDFGKQRDPTAIVVVEGIKVDRPGLRPEWLFETRHLERLALGTDYRAVGRRIAEVVRNIEARPVALNQYPPKLTLIVDATGVGRPVTDILKDALHGSRCKVTPATFTHGDRLVNGSSSGHYGELSVGKAFLVSRLQALFQTERIKLPANHPEATAMVDELMNYEIRVSEDASDKMGVFKTGKHDDLATALGLAVLMDPPGAGLQTF